VLAGAWRLAAVDRGQGVVVIWFTDRLVAGEPFDLYSTVSIEQRGYSTL
jgi:hypothetical protein